MKEEEISKALEKMLDGNRVGFSNIVSDILDEVAAQVIDDMRAGIRNGEIEAPIGEDTETKESSESETPSSED